MNVFKNLRRAIKLMSYMPAILLVMPIVVVSRVIRPFLVVRWGELRSDRIGHFMGNTEMYLCERDCGINVPPKRYIDIFFVVQPICNKQLAAMWSRVLRIWPSWMRNPIMRSQKIIPGALLHTAGQTTMVDRDVHNLLDRMPAHLKFSSDEITFAQLALRDLGIPEGHEYICFHARDRAYLDTVLKIDKSENNLEGTWRYQDYLDTTIQNFLPAADQLTDNGYYSIRMGAVVQNPIYTDNEKIIDYATVGRTDFMDIYLGSTCRFALGGPSGIMVVPMMFRRPLVLVNLIGLEYMATWGPNYILVPKKLWLRDKDRYMTFREILDSGVGRFSFSQLYDDYGIDIIENTPEEISQAAMEMDNRLDNNWQSTDEDEYLQQMFWKIFDKSELHGKICSRIGAQFLRDNTELLG